MSCSGPKWKMYCLFLSCVPVGVEGVDADAVDVWQVVDFDAFAGEGVGAEVDGGLGAFWMFGGEFGEAGDPGAETCFAVSADVVDLEAVFDFAELYGGGGVEDDTVGGQGFDELCVGQGRDRCGGAFGRVAREAAARPRRGGRPGRGTGGGRGAAAGAGAGACAGVAGRSPPHSGRVASWGGVLGYGGDGGEGSENENEQAEGQPESSGTGCSGHETGFSSCQT